MPQSFMPIMMTVFQRCSSGEAAAVSLLADTACIPVTRPHVQPGHLTATGIRLGCGLMWEEQFAFLIHG